MTKLLKSLKNVWSPILRVPDPRHTFVVQTDASDAGIGPVLGQQDMIKVMNIQLPTQLRETRYSAVEKGVWP